MFYHLALETICRMFAELRSTGMLQATFDGGPRKAVYTARAAILEGKLADCVVLTANGEIVAQGRDAYTMIAQRTLKWDFTPTRPSTLSQAINPLSPDRTGGGGLPPERQMMRSNQRVPVRTHEVTPGELATWPRQVRAVYSLINGVHTVERIERLTSLPENVVENILRQLEERNYIYRT